MERQTAQQAFVRYQRTSDPAALAQVFDDAAPELLLVAAHLTRVPADAEDLVQQTFLTAIAHAHDFDPARPLMPWLVAILARCAHRLRAKSSRRIEPRDLERPHVEDPIDAAAALEFAETIARRVAALPGHYRLVLNLRLGHGLTPTEIAHATEVPLETVRTRLKRGLELLRHGLPAGFAGLLGAFALSERGLAAVRAAVLSEVSAASAATSVFAVVGGSMIMKATVGFAAALVAAGLMWFVWPGNGATLEPAQSAPTIASLAATAPTIPVTQPVSPEAGRGKVSPAIDAELGRAASESLPPSSGIRGRIMNIGGAPAATCAIHAISFDPAESFHGEMFAHPVNDFTPIERDATTDADGHFEIKGLDARATLVLLAAPTDAPTTLFHPEFELHAGEITDVGELLLGQGATIVGRLFADGQPVAGASVRVAPDLPVSQEFGYRLSCLRPDLLCPESAVLWDARSDAAGPGGLVVIEPPAWVTSLWKSLGAPETTSDAEGRFRLTGVRAGNVIVTASKLGRFPKLATPTLKAGEALDLGDLELHGAETVRGRVLGVDGMPLANAEVLVGPRSLPGIDVHLLQRVGRTDSEGRFAIGGQAPREVFVAVRPAGESNWSASGPHGIGSEIEIRLPRRFELSIEVDRGALDAADVKLAIRAGRPRGELLALDIAGTVQTIDLRAGESRTKVTGLFEGIYDVCASARDSLAVHTSVELDGDLTVVLQLAPARGVVVHVLDSAGKPLTGARVFAGAADAPEWTRSILPADSGVEHWSRLPLASAHTDPSGLARLGGLPAGALTLVASHPGCSPRAIDVGAGDREVTLELLALGGLDVRIVREGRPIEDLRSLELVALGAESRAGLPLVPRRVATDGHGACKLRGLGAGRWRVSSLLPASAAASDQDLVFFSSFGAITSPMRRVRAEMEVEVLPGENASLVLEESATRLAPGAATLSVHGRVKVNGLSRGGLVVKAFDYERAGVPGRIPMLKAVADSDGYYRIDGLSMPSKSMQVSLELCGPDGDSLLDSEEIALPPGVADLEHVFDLEAGELVGLVHDRAGRAVAKCNVYIRGFDRFGLSIARETDAQGHFEFDLVPVGKISLQALTPGGNTNIDGIEIARGPNKLDVVLLEYCRVAGHVKLAAINSPAPMPIYAMIEMVDGPINYRPKGTVNRETGRFEITKVMAGDYRLRVWSNGTWWKHASIVHVLPEEAESLEIDPQPDTGPTELGPSPESAAPGYSDEPVGGF